MKGWHGDSVYFDDVLLTSPHPYNKFIAKISPSGNTIWAKSIQEYYWGFDYNQFDIDPAGNVYFGFYVRDTIQFGYEFMYVPEGRYDMIVAKYTSDGDLNWVKSIQGNESSSFWLSSVAVYNSSNIFAGGYFSSYLSLNDEVAKSYINHGFVIMLGDETWGVEEVYKRNNLGIEIYPNPSTGIVYLEFEKPFSGEIEIINSVGQVVRKYLISSMTMQQLDLSTLDKGVYVVHVSGENNSNSRRIILE